MHTNKTFEDLPFGSEDYMSIFKMFIKEKNKSVVVKNIKN